MKKEWYGWAIVKKRPGKGFQGWLCSSYEFAKAMKYPGDEIVLVDVKIVRRARK